MVTGSSSTTKRWAEVLFIGFISFKDGNENGKPTSLPHFTFYLYASRVVLDNLLTDRQSQSRTFSHFFCSKKRIESSLFRFLSNANSSVGNRDFQPSPILRGTRSEERRVGKECRSRWS